MDMFLVSHAPLPASHGAAGRWSSQPSSDRCVPKQLFVGQQDERALVVLRADEVETVEAVRRRVALPGTRSWLVAPIVHTPFVVPPGAQHVIVERHLSTSVSRPIVEVGMAQEAERFRRAAIAFVTSYLSVDGRTLVSHLLASEPAQVAEVNRAAGMTVTHAWRADLIDLTRAQ